MFQTPLIFGYSIAPTFSSGVYSMADRLIDVFFLESNKFNILITDGEGFWVVRFKLF